MSREWHFESEQTAQSSSVGKTQRRGIVWRFWMALYFVTWRIRHVAPKLHKRVNDNLDAAVKRRYPIC